MPTKAAAPKRPTKKSSPLPSAIVPWSARSPRRGSRAYAAASLDEWRSSWQPTTASANAEILASYPRLLASARNLWQNNPMAYRATWEFCLGIGGDGIRLRANTKDKALNEEIDGWFDLWAEPGQACDEIGFYGAQIQALQGGIRDGNSITRMHRARPEDGLVVPLRLQVLEVDYLDMTKYGRSDQGGRIIAGQGFDAIGRKTLYWLFGAHPGDRDLVDSQAFVSHGVMASSVAHFFVGLRAGQVLGVPQVTVAIGAMKDKADYKEGHIHRKLLENSIAAFVEGQPESNWGGVLGSESTPEDVGRATDANGFRLERFSDASIVYLPQGTSVKFPSPSQSLDYETFDRSTNRDASAGLLVPYERATGDLTGLSYAGGRLSQLPFIAITRHHRERHFNPRWNFPVWKAWCQAANLVGRVPSSALNALGYVPFRCSSPRLEAADRLTTAKAQIAELRGLLASPQDIAEENGKDIYEIIDEWKEYKVAMKDSGLVSDGDSSQTSTSGGLQPDASNTTSEN